MAEETPEIYIYNTIANGPAIGFILDLRFMVLDWSWSISLPPIETWHILIPTTVETN